MRFIYSALSILPAFATAKVLLAVGPEELAIGETYNVEWLVDTKMTLELWVIKQTPTGWNQVDTIFSGVTSKPCNGSYTWVVGDKITPGSGYALWINGENIPDDNHGYSDSTDWFNITAKEQELR